MVRLNRRRFEGWLREHWIERGCHHCQGTDFAVGRLLTLPVVVEQDLDPPDGLFLAVPVNCQQCGTINLVSPVIAEAVED